jgi:hypothetical protein
MGELGTTLAVTSNGSTLRRSVTSQKTAFFIVRAMKTSNITSQNLIQEEIKKRSNSSFACYHSVQVILYKSAKVRIYKTNFVFNFYGYKTWSLALKEERRQECSRTGCRGECFDRRKK